MMIMLLLWFIEQFYLSEDHNPINEEQVLCSVSFLFGIFYRENKSNWETAKSLPDNLDN